MATLRHRVSKRPNDEAHRQFLGRTKPWSERNWSATEIPPLKWISRITKIRKSFLNGRVVKLNFERNNMRLTQLALFTQGREPIRLRYVPPPIRGKNRNRLRTAGNISVQHLCCGNWIECTKDSRHWESQNLCAKDLSGGLSRTKRR